jgi:hypothetical protein
MWFIDGSPFYDNCVVDHTGKLISPAKNTEKAEAKAKEMRKKIDKYVALVDPKNIPMPSGGDCWNCCMRDKNGVTMGDSNEDHSHLLEHLKEGYLHGSILVNAIKEAGYRPEVYMRMPIGDTIQRCLRKYLVKRLITNS